MVKYHSENVFLRKQEIQLKKKMFLGPQTTLCNDKFHYTISRTLKLEFIHSLLKKLEKPTKQIKQN